jgi:hypothetical protein
MLRPGFGNVRNYWDFSGQLSQPTRNTGETDSQREEHLFPAAVATTTFG